jgi:hypothetical protein
MTYHFKPLLLSLLLVACVQSVGQQPAIAPLKFNSGVLVVDSTGGHITRDTVYAMFLMCDTVKQKYSGSDKIRKGDGALLILENAPKYKVAWVFWNYGYVVFEEGNFYIRTYYLNHKKQPMTGNLIVWDHRLIGERKRKPF